VIGPTLDVLLDYRVLLDYLSDTGSRRVRDYINRLDAHTLHISTVTVQEFERNIGLLRETLPAEAHRLNLCLDNTVVGHFWAMLLPFDAGAARIWEKKFSVETSRGKKPLPLLESMVAASALQHGLTVVTWHMTAYKPLGVPVYNPWTGTFSEPT